MEEKTTFISKIKSFFVFLFTKSLLKHFVIAALFLIFFGWFVMFSLKVYTRHGKSLEVPDLRGMQLEEMIETIEDMNLRYIITDSIYTDSVPKGTVYLQNPPAGFKVKRNRKIFITMNPWGIEMVKMPNLIEKNFREAQNDLRSLELEVGTIEYRSDGGETYDRVLVQRFEGKNIAAGTQIPKHSSIDLVLSERQLLEGEESNMLPNLLGKTMEQAQRTTKNAFLSLGYTQYDNSVRTSQDSARAQVYKQSPTYTPETPVAIGSNINIWLTVDKTKLRIIEMENEIIESQEQEIEQIDDEDEEENE